MKGNLARCFVSMLVCVFVFALSYSIGVCSTEINHQVLNMEATYGAFTTQTSGVEIIKDITLFQNTIVPGNLILKNGVFDLDGKSLTIEGNLIQESGTILVNGGELKVYGDYSISSEEKSGNAYLRMTNEFDYVTVYGSFSTYSSNSHIGYLTAGTMEIKGDFLQRSGSPGNFLAKGTHKIILSGEGIQTIDFENPDHSWMNILCITKPLDEGYNLVNDERVWVKLIKLFEETPKDSLEVSTSGDGFVKMNDEEILPTNYKYSFDIGTEIDLMGHAKEGSKFAYWEDVERGAILSTNAFYELIIGTTTKLKAVFQEDSEVTEEFVVVFKDKSGRILQSTKVAKNEAAVPPEDPYMIGYRFIGWSEDFSNVVSNMIVSPIFARLADQYTVTVLGGELSTGGTEGEYQFDVPIEVVADEPSEGMKFSHWEQDGIKVSTKNIFSFFMPMKDTQLVAVFIDDSDVIQTEPFITLSQDVLVDYIYKTMIFTATRNITDGHQLIESGIILLKSDKELEEPITLETENILHGKISNNSTQQFYVRKMNIEYGETWYGRAYLIYKDPEGVIKIVYSETTAKETLEMLKYY